MIISHAHRYVFVVLPYSATTAIGAELCEHHGGEPILSKHARYGDFLGIATSVERKHFVFSCIRNPLDEAVSHYFRYKTNHDEMFTDSETRVRYRISAGELRMYRWIQDEKPSFAEFLRRAYRIPHDNWSALSHRRFDHIIRFERLQVDFAEVLRRLGLEPKRPLPIRNQAGEKGTQYVSYYTPDVIPHAQRVFGCFMREWGYGFPSGWDPYVPPRREQLEFAARRVVRKAYWRYANRMANPVVRAVGVGLKRMLLKY